MPKVDTRVLREAPKNPDILFEVHGYRDQENQSVGINIRIFGNVINDKTISDEAVEVSREVTRNVMTALFNAGLMPESTYKAQARAYTDD